MTLDLIYFVIFLFEMSVSFEYYFFMVSKRRSADVFVLLRKPLYETFLVSFTKSLLLTRK